MTQLTDGMCTVCRRRPAAVGRLCTPDVTSATTLLNDLPRKLRLLPLMLMPGQSPPGQKVATTRVGSPTTTNLDALNLVGPGSIPVPGALHPLVRRWYTTREVTVAARVGTYRVDEHTLVLRDWHQELVIDGNGDVVMVPDDDQTGVQPPVEWLDQQAATWRRVFGHQLAPAAYVRGPGPRPPRDPVQWLLTHGTPEQVKTMFAVEELHRRYRQGVTDLVVGHEPGHAGNRPAGLRELDPVADLWNLRFGEPALTRATSLNVNYLRTWLHTAADHDAVDIAAFIAELRSLSAELTRVLGEKPDNQWLGKCPAAITDHATGEVTDCGAGLWQDPHASVVECPRCHSSWGPRPVHLVHLAAEIRRVWPLDRRRRYHADEVDALKPLPCPLCADPVVVDWQEVTAGGDTRRWWRPAKTRCRNGCDRARELL